MVDELYKNDPGVYGEILEQKPEIAKYLGDKILRLEHV